MILERDSLILRGCIKKGEHVSFDMFPLSSFFLGSEVFVGLSPSFMGVY